MDNYILPKNKNPEVISGLDCLLDSKVNQETIAWKLDAQAKSPTEKSLAKALARSNRIMAEDYCREMGFMLPQSVFVKEFLENLLKTGQDAGFPIDDIKRLMQLL
jgi:hypothetical protein